jgi:hypothetical protein
MLSRSGAALLRTLGARAAPAAAAPAPVSAQAAKGTCRNALAAAPTPPGAAARGNFGIDGRRTGISRAAALGRRPSAPPNAMR